MPHDARPIGHTLYCHQWLNGMVRYAVSPEAFSDPSSRVLVGDPLEEDMTVFGGNWRAAISHADHGGQRSHLGYTYGERRFRTFADALDWLAQDLEGVDEETDR